MNARLLNFILGALVAGLVAINGVTLALLLRYQSQNAALRSQLATATQFNNERVPSRAARVQSPEEIAAAAMVATQTLSIVLGEVNQEDG
jgi:hypothetical protein